MIIRDSKTPRGRIETDPRTVNRAWDNSFLIGGDGDGLSWKEQQARRLASEQAIRDTKPIREVQRDAVSYWITCGHCGEYRKMEHAHAQYCSRRCKMQARRARLKPPPVQMKCDWCHRDFLMTGRGTTRLRRWCSVNCASANQRRRKREEALRASLSN